MPRHARRGTTAQIRTVGRVAFCMLVILALVPAMSVGAAPAAEGGPSRITILPINNAQLLAGQRFDLRIEVGDNLADNTDASTFQVLVDGKTIKNYFGKDPVKSNTTPQTAELTVRQVTFASAGRHTVSVNAGGKTATVGYDIVRPQAPQGRRAKNVIFFLGDGMSWQTLTIARTVSKGLTEGKFNGRLNIDKMDEVGYITTSGYDSLVTDSANSMSAYMTGQKGVVNAMGVYADNTADPNDDPRVENMIEVLKRTRGMATGLVVSSEIEDATPAATFAHTRRRAQKQYIADQLLDDPNHQPEVILGGGSAYFIPKSTAGSKRTDERNLLDDFKKAGYTLAGNRAEMNAAGTPKRLLGLFHPGDMNVWIDREYTKDPSVLGPYTDQPTVYEMTQKALDVLSSSQNGRQNGFFLMVEGSSIDKQLHPMDWERAAGDTIEMDKAVGVAKAYAAKNPDTLIVVMADHSHSVSMYGTYDTTKGPGNPEAVGVYDQAKFPTFTDSNGDGFPDNWSPSRTLAVGFGNHPEYRDDFLFNPRPVSPTIQDPSAPSGVAKFIANPARDPQGILYPSNLPSFEGTEVHSADDAPLFASGPGARNFHGIRDNTEIFYGVVSALGIDATRSKSQGSTGSTGAGLALGALMTLGVVVGAGRYLRRPGSTHVGPITLLAQKAGRFGRALRAAGRSFSTTLHNDDRE